jgi:hypothetical protein
MKSKATVRRICGFCLVVVLLAWGGAAQVGQLVDRLGQFSRWEAKRPVSAAEGDLVYPA